MRRKYNTTNKQHSKFAAPTKSMFGFRRDMLLVTPYPMVSWLAVDPWEVTRKRIMDYMSVLEHAKEVCHETFPGHAGDITILYMCQASQVTLFSRFTLGIPPSISCFGMFTYSTKSALVSRSLAWVTMKMCFGSGV